MTINRAETNLTALRHERHPGCVICGARNKRGLRLDFQPDGNGGVEASFLSRPPFQGYTGLLHGGVIASLLDGAMTNCLFTHGYAALTAELNVRFLKPIPLNRAVRVRASLENSRPPHFRVAAEIRQGGELMARATAIFLIPSLPQA